MERRRMREVTALKPQTRQSREVGTPMKRIYAFAIGLAMLVAPMATAGLAAADPGARSMDYQQATDIVVQRGLSQRGVPFSWAGGGVNGPTRGKGTGAMTVGFDASGLMQYAYAGAGIKLPRSSGELYRVGQKILPQQAQPRRPDLLRSWGHAKRRDVPRQQPDARGGRRRPGFAGAHQRHDALPGSGSRGPAKRHCSRRHCSRRRPSRRHCSNARPAGADAASCRQQAPRSKRRCSRHRCSRGPLQQAPLQQAPLQQAPVQQAPLQQMPAAATTAAPRSRAAAGSAVVPRGRLSRPFPNTATCSLAPRPGPLSRHRRERERVRSRWRFSVN